VNILYAAATHRGSRADNQDCLYADGWVAQASGTRSSGAAESAAGLLTYAVFDGMGGHAGGALAAVVAGNALASKMREYVGDISAADLAEVVDAASAAIDAVAADAPGLRGMGCTVAGVVLSDSVVHAFNVGDCRAYRLQSGYVVQISVDDRLRDESGRRSNVVTQSLGGSGDQRIDPHVHSFALDAPADIVLCSDGVHDAITADELERCVKAEHGGLVSPAEGVERIIAAVLAAGAPDNVSVLWLRLG